jgi:hypothetical protein
MRGGDLRFSPPSTALTVSAKTAAYTLIPQDSGTVFTNRGATGSVTFTLPDPTVNEGMHAYIYIIADFAIVVAGAVADTMVIPTDDAGTGDGDLAADSFTLATSNEMTGNGMHCICDGTGWLVMVNFADGVAFTITT